MGPSMGLVSLWLPSVWIAFTLALTVAALKIFLRWFLTDTGRQTSHPVYNL